MLYSWPKFFKYFLWWAELIEAFLPRAHCPYLRCLYFAALPNWLAALLSQVFDFCLHFHWWGVALLFLWLWMWWGRRGVYCLWAHLCLVGDHMLWPLCFWLFVFILLFLLEFPRLFNLLHRLVFFPFICCLSLTLNSPSIILIVLHLKLFQYIIHIKHPIYLGLIQWANSSTFYSNHKMTFIFIDITISIMRSRKPFCEHFHKWWNLKQRTIVSY